jgi:nicotinate-nucleotide--dimethylbenzimidazole phosphoribosyltransferase
MGIINNEATWPNVRNHAVSTGTRNLMKISAMTLEQCDAALKTGHTLANKACEQGHNLLIIGEMGIGNTTSASAILAALTSADAEQVVGPGTGANAEQQALKAKVISAALSRFDARDAKTILCEVGGFEIAAMVGVLVSAKSLNIAVMVDGFIATAAAMIANGIAPESRSHWIFAHESAEPAHQLMLKALEAKPLLQLGLRLGEGTGSALAYPIVKCAVAMLNEMATFADAGISES